ncbi:solute carrier family 26 member 6 isoform X1 [Stegostoma tigrinum]|uniref:solute carrier family 26 member 6 isoform X1 n=1 Tax=Stegostoma tigrinum TaxID=3053191 RepID=UPI00287094BB|nr:solute carrier family 26 member 6 isoform X1 [Stegostoma tigrinum]XP_059505760.1 solute carrier family 26 member 6 isoform X1 [Stegostoma tigrinum]XP_059505761.1 solute carrier family 26 member 6 isoform X1 [Stegostoma tigrinum]XP_059505762.1 solute carrier family 26 member 6 isoform X1 [Stegostoma tigrinum]XP_059505763.1 solute carrier family 26 member 6 isoform X1 [Stegostoma tigrinum]
MIANLGDEADSNLEMGKPKYHVERQVMSEERLEVMAQWSKKTEPSLKDKLKENVRCSSSKAKSLLFKFVPILHWLPKYPYQEWLLGDICSGLSVGIVQLPQSMAYALLAAVPPVYGLYTSFFPVLIYFIFGTSRHVSVGSFAVLSVMLGTITERIAPDEDFVISSQNNTNGTVDIDIEARDLMRVKAATMVTFLCGIFQIMLGLIRFGFVVTYLSDPLVRGYTTGAAVHVLVSQLKYVFSIAIPRKNGPLSLIYTLIDVIKALHLTNTGTLVVSIIAMSTMFAVKVINDRFKSKLPIPIPIELIEVIIATVIASNVDLVGKYGIQVVGHIPKGLQAPVPPDFSIASSLVGSAFALAIVGYGITISLGKIFALKHGYQVDSNQELIALGLSNFVGGFFQCFAVSCSMSRSLVQETTGGNTQLAAAVSSVVILVIILEIGALFSQLPKAVLASIVIINLKGMFEQVTDIFFFWRTNKIDLIVWIVTLICTVLLGMDLGLAASIAFALLTVIFQAQFPKYSILGQIPKTDIYRDVSQFDAAKEIPGIKIFQSSTTIFFANAELYEEALKQVSGINVSKLVTKKKKKITALKKKLQKQEKKKDKKQQKQQKLSESGTNGPATITENIDNNNSISLEMDSDLDLPSKVSKKPEEFSLESLGLQKPNVHSLILDFSPVNFVDTVCIKILKNIFRDFKEIEIDVYLSGCHWAIIEQFEQGGFFGKNISKSQIFTTVHDAVLYCMMKNNPSTDQALHMNGTLSLPPSQDDEQESTLACAGSTQF